MDVKVCEKSYGVEARFTNFYAGGEISWCPEGKQLYCLNGAEVNAVNVATGQVLHSYTTVSKTENNQVDSIEQDPIYCFALSLKYLVTAHQSGLLRLWDINTKSLIKLWKAQHKGPIVKVAFNENYQLLCSSGADSTLRLWDLVNSTCACALKDFHGPALLIKFHTSHEIYAAGADNTVYCFNYQTKELIRKLRGHLSLITGLEFHTNEENCQQLATVSRDKVLIIWQLQPNGAKQLKVLPLYEELTGVAFLASGKNLVVATDSGKLKLIDLSTSQIVELLSQSEFHVSNLLYCPATEQLATVSAEQNVLIYNIDFAAVVKLNCVKQLIGNNDDILDMCFVGSGDRYLAVATNSKHFKLYDTQDQMNCRLITGHKDTVMSISSARDRILSAGKDHSIKIWKLDDKHFGLTCLTTQFSCHTSTIGCVAFAHNYADQFASVSQDGSMKVWQLSRNKEKEFTVTVRYASLAHDKEVNCVNYSPNNKIIATSSQDKTAKLWHADRNTCLGVLRGHTRGVWCVRFSPVDQVVLTSSSDCSLRIWSIENFTCLKRLEQECTVLRVEFIDHGKYIVSTASDGLIKLWNIKTNACIQTIDEHDDRVWALAIPTHTNKFYFSGGGDSKIIRFTDITQTICNEALEKRQTQIKEEQALQSLLHQRKNLQKAFVLALTLNKPKALFDIINVYTRQRDNAAIKRIVDQLNNDQRTILLEHVKSWSTNARYSQAANLVFQHLLDDALARSSVRTFSSNFVEVTTPYVQRHFNRITELNKELAFLDFIMECM